MNFKQFPTESKKSQINNFLKFAKEYLKLSSTPKIIVIDDPYRWDYGRNQSIVTSRRGRRIQQRVRDLEDSGNQETADRIHRAASNISNQERGLAKQKRNKRRGPGPRRARQDAMRDMSDSGF